MAQASVSSSEGATKTSHRKRNIGIAAILVVALVIGGLYLAGIFTGGHSPLNPFDFELQVSPPSGTVIQGQSIQTTVVLNLSKGWTEQVTLNASGGPNGATYNFSPVAGSPNFTSTLSISVPDSVPTDAYSVTVTATGVARTHSTSYTLSVLSAKVTVHGTVTTTGIGTHPTGIQFINTASGLAYSGTMDGTSYSVSLPNRETYRVVCGWQGFLGNTGTFEGGTLRVDAGVGTTTVTQDFTG